MMLWIRLGFVACVFMLLSSPSYMLAEEKLEVRYLKLGQEWAKMKAALLATEQKKTRLYLMELANVLAEVKKTSVNESDPIAPVLDTTNAIHRTFAKFQTVGALEKHSDEVRGWLNLANEATATKWTAPLIMPTTTDNLSGDTGYLAVPFMIVVPEEMTDEQKELTEQLQSIPPPSLAFDDMNIDSIAKYGEAHQARMKLLWLKLEREASISPFQIKEIVKMQPLKLVVKEVSENGFLGAPIFANTRPLFIEPPSMEGITKGQEYTLLKMVVYKGRLPTPFNFQETYRVLNDEEIQRVQAFVKSRKVIKQSDYFRRWIDTQTNNSLEALFLSAEEGKVRLKSEDGKIISIDRDRLSQKDQDWIFANYCDEVKPGPIEWIEQEKGSTLYLRK